MISSTLHQTQKFNISDPRQRKALALMAIFSMHVLILLAIFQTPHFSAIKRSSSALILRIFDTPTKTKQEKPTEEIAKRNTENQTALVKNAPYSNTEKPAKSLPIQTGSSQAEKAEKTETEKLIDPALDPFAMNQSKESKAAISSERERYRHEAGKAWKQVESELPVKRWLSTKKELSTMEKFAQDLLDAAPAREIQTKEEMRPDGSRMTRVKTPRGEFCVVAPQPGRTYDVRGPEHRVMHCPIYF